MDDTYYFLQTSILHRRNTNNCSSNLLLSRTNMRRITTVWLWFEERGMEEEYNRKETSSCFQYSARLLLNLWSHSNINEGLWNTIPYEQRIMIMTVLSFSLQQYWWFTENTWFKNENRQVTIIVNFIADENTHSD